MYQTLCACGCGQPTVVRNGKAATYVHNHHLKNKPSHWRGKKRPPDATEKMVRTRTGADPVPSPYVEGATVWFSRKGGRWFAYLNGKGKKTHASLVYEHHYGPVPDGHHVHHKNGKRESLEDDRPDNLMLLPAEWNLRFMPTLAKGFGMDETQVTSAYERCVGRCANGDLFPSVVAILLEERLRNRG